MTRTLRPGATFSQHFIVTEGGEPIMDAMGEDALEFESAKAARGWIAKNVDPLIRDQFSIDLVVIP